MQARPLVPGRTMPLVIEPARGENGSPDALAAWAGRHRDAVDGWLHRAGAVLLRGFGITDAGEFRAVAEALEPDLRPYVGGDSPRSAVADRVYTSTEFPAHLEIGLHNELSYAGWWPRRVLFCCLVAAERGGETHIADARRILASLDGPVRERFERNGITYVQHLRDAQGPPGPGKSWQQTFETDDRATVEHHCRTQGMTFEWTARGLRTALTNPGVIPHPVTGEPCWFNQADLWCAGFDPVKDREDAAAGPAALGSHARYGDGSEIPVEDLEAVRAAYRATEITFRWRAGDLLVLDNLLALHGRKPYRGARRVLVAMG